MYLEIISGILGLLGGASSSSTEKRAVRAAQKAEAQKAEFEALQLDRNAIIIEKSVEKQIANIMRTTKDIEGMQKTGAAKSGITQFSIQPILEETERLKNMDVASIRGQANRSAFESRVQAMFNRQAGVRTSQSAQQAIQDINTVSTLNAMSGSISLLSQGYKAFKETKGIK